MPSVLICRAGQEDSVLGNVALARLLAGKGEEVHLVFAGEALHALRDGTFEWSSNFLAREPRARVIAGAERCGLPLADKGRDPRWSDVRALVRWAAELPGVRVVACPLWSALFDAADLPPYLERITDAELATLLKSADTIVGGY